MSKMQAYPWTAAALGLILTTGWASAQDESSNRVAIETAWSVFVEEDPQECWLVSAPQNTRNTRNGEVVSVQRGETLLYVTFRPSTDANGVVSFTGGYPFADGSTVTMTVGDSTFDMFVQGEFAWPASSAEDQQVVSAMRAGADAVLRGRSSRGTNTEDTFSLFGFTAAFEEAQSRCSS